jgi:hypothetical protein
MRYRRAVEKLRILAEECDSQRTWPGEDPLLREAYVFGDLFEGPDELERVELALVLACLPSRLPGHQRRAERPLGDASNGCPP